MTLLTTEKKRGREGQLGPNVFVSNIRIKISLWVFYFFCTLWRRRYENVLHINALLLNQCGGVVFFLFIYSDFFFNEHMS